MSSLASEPKVELSQATIDAVAHEVRNGLSEKPRTLSPWLFYDEAGSSLFEQITLLPEYYLTRTERSILASHADEIILLAAGDQCVTLAELGAGTATKTGLLLEAAVRHQSKVTYKPVDCSESALDEARENIERKIPGVTVLPQVANYVTDPVRLSGRGSARPHGARMLVLYIGSSIGNFSPVEAREILTRVRAQLAIGDTLLLGTDLAPGKYKDEATLVAAYDDAEGVTAAFNLNILSRINRDLGANFNLEGFRHRAIWNAVESRIEMHLESVWAQRVYIPANASAEALTLDFAPGETIHTENSRKFTEAAILDLLNDSGFALTLAFTDPASLFAVSVASAI